MQIVRPKQTLMFSTTQTTISTFLTLVWIFSFFFVFFLRKTNKIIDRYLLQNTNFVECHWMFYTKSVQPAARGPEVARQRF